MPEPKPGAELGVILRKHPITVSVMQQDAAATIERSIWKVREEEKDDNFTVGTLGRKTRAFVYAPYVLVSRATSTVIAVIRMGVPLQGYPGYVHGGVFPIMADECCGRSIMTYFENVTGKPSASVTMKLETTYLKPIPTSSNVLVHAVVDTEKSNGRKAIANAKIWVLSADKPDILAAEIRSFCLNPYSQKL